MAVGQKSCQSEKCPGKGGCATAGRTGKLAEPRPAIDPPRRPFEFAIRTTAAALLALGAAELLSIDHPWWAAMTAWLVAQPTRGLLLERSLARLAGTFCGVVAGVQILASWGNDLPVALMLLACWLALCTGLGTNFRHFRNYSFVLAGYTAGIVVLFGLGDEKTNMVLAQDRVLCTLIGIVCSVLLSFRVLPSPGEAGEALGRHLLDRVLRWAEAGHCSPGQDTAHSLASEISAFDRSIDEKAAGSFHHRVDALRLRYISGVLLELIALPGPELGKAPEAARSHDNPVQRTRHLAQSAVLNARPAIAHALRDLAGALEPNHRSVWRHYRFNIDGATACRAAALPVLALAVATAIWLATRWQTGSMMAMTAVLFTSLFSSHDHGNHMVVQVLLGTIVGATTGLIVRLLLLPHADGLLTTLFCVTPFLLSAAWLMRHPATAKMAIDMAMTFLLTAQPGSALAPAGIVLSEAAAIVSGVVIALAMFWLILPSMPDVWRRLLARRISRLTARTALDPGCRASASRHEALRNTQVRLLDFTKADSPLFTAAQTCLAAAAEARNRPTETAREEALKASAALDALIISSTRKKKIA